MTDVEGVLDENKKLIPELSSKVAEKMLHKKIISGDPEKVKKVYDTWTFSKDIKSTNPNWFLIDTQA